MQCTSVVRYEKIANLRCIQFYEYKIEREEQIERLIKNEYKENPDIFSSWLLARIKTDTSTKKQLIDRSIKKLEEVLRLGKDIKQVIIGVNNRQLGFQCLNIPLITGAINNESIKKIYFYANPKNTANIHLLKSTVRVLQEEKKVKIVTNRRDIWNRSIYDNAIC